MTDLRTRVNLMRLGVSRLQQSTRRSEQTLGGASMRQHQRITETQDLSATLWTPGRRFAARPVLNLGEGGMLVAELKLDVGNLASFEIAGLYFRYAGLAAVVHTTDWATGLHFMRWQGQADRPLRALIAARVVRQRVAAHEAGTIETPAVAREPLEC